MNRRDWLIGAASALSVPLAAHAQAPSTTDWNAVISAAKKEGKLTVYSANAGEITQNEIARDFEKKYGIPVEILVARASEIRERIRTEQAANRAIADLSHNGATTTALQVAEGTFQPHGGIPNLSKLRTPFTATDIRVPVFASAYAILVNTAQVKPEQMPKSWADLADPRWKDKILSDDMRALGGGSVLFFVTMDKLGRAFHEKLASNQPQFSRDLTASTLRVARGEFPIWIPMGMAAFAPLKGLPVKMVIPQEGVPYITYELAILRNAPHPNAARLFMDYYLGVEGQLVHAKRGNLVVRDGITEGVAPEILELAQARLFGTTDPTRQDEMLKLAKEIYR
jgi:iron(III) transport system substrate-binding protein